MVSSRPNRQLVSRGCGLRLLDGWLVDWRLRRLRRGPVLLSFHKPVEVREVVTHRAALAGAQFDNGNAEVPSLRSPNSDLNVTAAMAILMIVLAEFFELRSLGVGGYLKGLLIPNPMRWLEIFTRPLSLSFRLFGLVAVGAIHIGVLIMWERDAKLGNKARGLLAKTRKWTARRVVWCRLHVAVQANLRGRSLACEESLSMTIQARCMFRKIGDCFRGSASRTTCESAPSSQPRAAILPSSLHGSTSFFRSCASGEASPPARSRAVSSRCARSVAR